MVMAPEGQTSMQLSQPRHSSSLTGTALSSCISKVPVGQTLTHSSSPVHLSASTSTRQAINLDLLYSPLRQKNPCLSAPRGFQRSSGNSFLNLGYRDRPGRTDFYTTFAAQAFVFIDWNGFVVLHLKDGRGTNVDAFLVPGALIGIHFHPPSH